MKRSIINKNRPLMMMMMVVLFIILLPVAGQASYTLLLNSFRNAANAERYVKSLVDKGILAYSQPFEMKSSGNWYRVLSGTFETVEKAQAEKQEVILLGLENVMVISLDTPLQPTASNSQEPQDTLQPETKELKTATTDPLQPQIVQSDFQTRKPLFEPAVSLKTKPPQESPQPVSQLSTAAPETELPNSPPAAPLSLATDSSPERNPPAAVEVVSVVNTKDTLLPTVMKDSEDAGTISPMPEKVLAKDTLVSTDLDDTYRIMPGDLLRIDIPEQKDMSRLYDVDPDGNIYLLMVGRVNVKGLTIKGLFDLLLVKAKLFIPLGQILSVKLVRKMRYVNVMGGVRYPGWYRFDRVLRLNEVISLAGGLLADTKDDDIILKRESPTGYVAQTATQTLVFEPNDIVQVPSPTIFKQRVDAGDLIYIRIPDEKRDKQTMVEAKNAMSLEEQRQVEVDQNGYIAIPFVGHVHVDGLSTEEVVDLIKAGLPKYLLRTANVMVRIIEKRHFVRVLGHVESPNNYNLKESGNVQTAIKLAGNAIDGAVLDQVTIIRRVKNQIRRIPVNLYQFTITGDERLLPPLHENDTLFVPISSNFGSIKRTLGYWSPPEERLQQDSNQKVRIFGAVINPGTYEPAENMDLLDLIILAGGNSPNAEIEKILIIRDQETFKYNLRKLIDDEKRFPGRIPNILSGDTVYVSFIRPVSAQKQDPTELIRIIGAVMQPGLYEPIKGMNLLGIVSVAEGFTNSADQSDVRIVRGDKIIKVDARKLFDPENLTEKKWPLVYAKDTVFVNFLRDLSLLKQNPFEMVRIIGAVHSPGLYEPQKNMNLLDAITVAQGPNEDADMSDVRLTRDGVTTRYDLNRALDPDSAYDNQMPAVMARDTILVSFAPDDDDGNDLPDERFYIMGEIASPGAHQIAKGGMTILQAIALAGDLGEWANKKEIKIVRMVDGRQETLKYNYNKGIAGRYPELNMRVKQNDVIIVP